MPGYFAAASFPSFSCNSADAAVGAVVGVGLPRGTVEEIGEYNTVALESRLLDNEHGVSPCFLWLLVSGKLGICDLFSFFI